jgi:hypothetical protein
MEKTAELFASLCSISPKLEIVLNFDSVGRYVDMGLDRRIWNLKSNEISDNIHLSSWKFLKVRYVKHLKHCAKLMCQILQLQRPLHFDHTLKIKSDNFLTRAEGFVCNKDTYFCLCEVYIFFCKINFFSHRQDRVSIPVQTLCDLWWTKWHWGRFFSELLDFPLTVSFHQSSILIFIVVIHI